MMLLYPIRRSALVDVDFSKQYQTIDGFGVNINSKYWRHGKLAPVVDLLIDDLGATLFRLDCFGRADWIDQNGTLGKNEALAKEHLLSVYSGDEFQNALGMAKYINSRGILPYITISGKVPAWMCADDGKTLVDFVSYAIMIADYTAWLRSQGVRFTLIGPLNETDIGPPEGPLLSPTGYVSACEAIIAELEKRDLADIRLVVAEQAVFNMDYVNALIQSKKLSGKIDVFSIHAYSDYHACELPARIQNLQNVHQPRAWMTEFGDLKQSLDHEELIAWASAKRLMRLLDDGMHGALSWDAYDNYHDHDEAWTCFGLLFNSWGQFIPKKRYYAIKHVYRYVRPGFTRYEVQCSDSTIVILAFGNIETDKVTIVGMNPNNYPVLLELQFNKTDSFQNLEYQSLDVYRTSSLDACSRVTTPRVIIDNHATSRYEVALLPESIFTVSNVH